MDLCIWASSYHSFTRQALGAMPISCHYSIGFASLMWQVILILAVLSGIILTPTVVAMDKV